MNAIDSTVSVGPAVDEFGLVQQLPLAVLDGIKVTLNRHLTGLGLPLSRALALSCGGWVGLDPMPFDAARLGGATSTTYWSVIPCEYGGTQVMPVFGGWRRLYAPKSVPSPSTRTRPLDTDVITVTVQHASPMVRPSPAAHVSLHASPAQAQQNNDAMMLRSLSIDRDDDSVTVVDVSSPPVSSSVLESAEAVQ